MRALILMLVICSATLGCDQLGVGERAAAGFTRTAVAADKQPTTYVSLVDGLDGRIVRQAERAAQHSTEWLPLQDLAESYRQRASLTGNWNDYEQCRATLAKAFELAPPNSGPLMTRAKLNFSLHRLPQVTADINTMANRPLVSSSVKRNLDLLRADVAYQGGRYSEALAGYRRAADWDLSGVALTKLADYHWHTGGWTEAEALFRQAEAMTSSDDIQGRAWIHLQLGLLNLDRKQYDAALIEYKLGAEILPGWWLLDEHIAEIYALKSENEEALARYQDLIERTGNPEFMDALAGVYRSMGRETEARELIVRAESLWLERLRQQPESAYGHALGHFLEFGDDPQRTVDLARANYELRPNGEAHILLAEAFLKADNPVSARRVVDEALQSPYRMPSLEEIAAEAYSATGHRYVPHAQASRVK